jgi:hypothetical protein
MRRPKKTDTRAVKTGKAPVSSKTARPSKQPVSSETPQAGLLVSNATRVESSIANPRCDVPNTRHEREFTDKEKKPIRKGHHDPGRTKKTGQLWKTQLDQDRSKCNPKEPYRILIQRRDNFAEGEQDAQDELARVAWERQACEDKAQWYLKRKALWDLKMKEQEKEANLLMARSCALCVQNAEVTRVRAERKEESWLYYMLLVLMMLLMILMLLLLEMVKKLVTILQRATSQCI